MGVMGWLCGVIGGTMGVITRCDHGVALRGVYGGLYGVYGCNYTV